MSWKQPRDRRCARTVAEMGAFGVRRTTSRRRSGIETGPIDVRRGAAARTWPDSAARLTFLPPPYSERRIKLSSESEAQVVWASRTADAGAVHFSQLW